MKQRLSPTAVRYAPPLALLTTPWVRFFSLSLGFHLLLSLILLLRNPITEPTEPAPIVVSLAPTESGRREQPASLPKGALPPNDSARPIRAKIAPKDSPLGPTSHEPVRQATVKKDPASTETARKAEAVPIPAPPVPTPRPSTREEVPEKAVIAERELPTVKQLLPPLYSADSGASRSRIPLETKEPQYVSYFTSIKRSIDASWKYPELALRYGLQGRLIVEFEILETGQLEGLRVIRSSGSALLDDEALRAIRSAAPFAPIPRWIEQKPLAITARMEYHDGRLTRPAR